MSAKWRCKVCERDRTESEFVDVVICRIDNVKEIVLIISSFLFPSLFFIFIVTTECQSRHLVGRNFWSVPSVQMSLQLISVHQSHWNVDTQFAKNVLERLQTVLMTRWVLFKYSKLVPSVRLSLLSNLFRAPKSDRLRHTKNNLYES